MGFLPNELPSLATLGAELTRGGHGPVPMLLERTAAFTQLTNGWLFDSWNSLAFIEEAKRQCGTFGSAFGANIRLVRRCNHVQNARRAVFRSVRRSQPATCMALLAAKGREPSTIWAALTIFADYKLPQVLRHYGVLAYSPALANNATLIPPGDPREVEIRAATIIACERLRAVLAQAGINTLATQIDWNHLGQAAKKEAMRPYHRTRTIFY